MIIIVHKTSKNTEKAGTTLKWLPRDDPFNVDWQEGALLHAAPPVSAHPHLSPCAEAQNLREASPRSERTSSHVGLVSEFSGLQ